jgi:hypothetical protein
MEPTGHYWWNLANWLANKGLNTVAKDGDQNECAIAFYSVKKIVQKFK